MTKTNLSKKLWLCLGILTVWQLVPMNFVLAQTESQLTITDLHGEIIHEIEQGSGFFVIIEDLDENSLPNFIETLDAVLMSEEGLLIQDIQLQETEEDSGIFQSNFLSTQDIAPGAALQVIYTDPDLDGDVSEGYVEIQNPQTGYTPGVHRERIIVKFKEGTQIRLRDGNLMSLDPAIDLLGLGAALQQHGVFTIERLFEEPEQELEAQRAELAGTPGPPLEDFNLFYVLHTGHLVDPGPLLRELQGLTLVEEARYYQHPLVQAQVDLSATSSPLGTQSLFWPQASITDTPDFQGGQGYLGPAPSGIDAVFAHTIPGGKGRNIQVLDLEQGWNLQHEDLTCCFLSDGEFPLDGIVVNHGTAVLGIIGGTDNQRGILGVAPLAKLGVVSWFQGLVSRRIKWAADRLSAGDVLLLEGQIGPPLLPEDCGAERALRCLPIEVARENFLAINYAVKKGIVVVEAAGNSGLSLDAPTSYGGVVSQALSRAAPDFLDSGAIVVGAGSPSNHPIPERERLPISNYGSRLDVQAWGRKVATSGGPPVFPAVWYNDLFDGGPNRQYTKAFAGTSSAAAIVAGAVASLQGVRKAQGALVLDSRSMRQLLASTGTPQPTPDEPIGPLPNLRAALAALDQEGAPPPPPPSPRPIVTSPVQLMDRDNDGFIGDQEVQFAIQLWITGQSVPESDPPAILDDEDVQLLIQIWISGQPIANFTQETATPLSLGNALRVGRKTLSHQAERYRLHVAGQGIASLQLEVFDLSGRRLLDQTAQGTRLEFAAMDRSGQRWSNGVYLYTLTVRGVAGDTVRSNVHKLVVLN